MQFENSTLYQVEYFPHRVNQNEHRLIIVVKATFDFENDGNFELSDPQLEINYGEEMEETDNGAILLLDADTVPFKPKTDIIVLGNAYVPQGRASTFCKVAVKVGDFQRQIQIFGDRVWRKSSIVGEIEKSETQSFSEMPLDFRFSFGGSDAAGNSCLENPIGRGFVSDLAKKSIEGVALPNIEDPNFLIEKWQDRPKPIGMGAIAKSWPQRMQYIGTYDERWQTQKAPDPPDDFNPLFYNSAHPAMQIDGFLKGDEEVELINLTPEGHEQFSLPNLNPKGLVRIQDQSDDFPLPLNLDTLTIMTEQRQFFLLWRGQFAIKDLTAGEIQSLQISFA